MEHSQSEKSNNCHQEDRQSSSSVSTSSQHEEAHSLLRDDYHDFAPPVHRRWRQVFFILLPWLINAVLLVLVLFLFASSSGQLTCSSVSPTDRAEYSPRGVPSEYHSVVFSRAFARESTPYQGWPDDEKDKLWRDLYWDGIAIHINEESQERLINKSQRVPIEGYEQDFLTGLGVFHQIHCLNMIRMQLYPGRYNVSLRNANGTINYIQWLHIDHCVEALRQVLVCQADTTAVPFVWSDASKLMAAGMGTTHMCRDFEKVREWAFARSLTWDNERAHVESGEIVDYSDWPLDPADTYFLNPPQGWEEAEESRLQDL